MDRLKGKTALVVGGSSGIGREVCRLFAREGADVAVGDVGRDAEGQRLVEEIRGLGREALFIPVDVREEAMVEAAVAGAIARFGQLDILVNNAGIGGYHGPVQEATASDQDAVLAVNLRGVFLGMKHALPHMTGRRSGRIINTASQLSHRPSPLNSPYCAAKAGVVALTASVAYEVATQWITVNAVCPGPTDTRMQQAPGDGAWKAWKLESLPMQRLGQPIEIAWAYVYLASNEASFCTGQSLSPNGGDVMWQRGTRAPNADANIMKQDR